MAKGVTIEAEKREKTGSRAARALRATGRVPGVIYGRGAEETLGPVLHVSIDGTALREALQAAGRLVQLEVGGTTEVTMVKDVQWDTFGSELLHVDFERIDPTQPVEVRVPLSVRGIAKGQVQGGKIHMGRRSVRISALPHQLPERIEVHVDDLEASDSLRVKDLKAPEGVTILTAPEEMVLVITLEEEEEAPAEEEALEAAAAEVPEGAAEGES